jgi:hypothetical protein
LLALSLLLLTAVLVILILILILPPLLLLLLLLLPTAFPRPHVAPAPPRPRPGLASPCLSVHGPRGPVEGLYPLLQLRDGVAAEGPAALALGVSFVGLAVAETVTGIVTRAWGR